MATFQYALQETSGAAAATRSRCRNKNKLTVPSGLSFDWRSFGDYSYVAVRRSQLRQPQESSYKRRSSVTALLAPPPLPAVSLPSQLKHETVGSCQVYHPATKPKAILHFLGGAFVGKTPDLFYNYFIELLVDEGFLVIATPYDVTFDHTSCVNYVTSEFALCLKAVELNGLASAGLSPGDAGELPVFNVGHSNGALLHVLSGTLSTEAAPLSTPSRVNPLPTPPNVRAPKGSVIIAYNNRPASEAVPFFDQVGPAVRQATPALQSLLASGPGIILAAAEQLLETIERSREEIPQLLPPDVADPIERFASQIGPVLGQVQDGVSEFTPTPAQNLRTIGQSYSVPSTLLIQFSDDTIDETKTLEATLRAKISQEKTSGSEQKLETILLNGTHATPLAPDLRWDVGPVFTPADAVAVAVKTAALADLRSLARTITSWIKYNL